MENEPTPSPAAQLPSLPLASVHAAQSVGAGHPPHHYPLWSGPPYRDGVYAARPARPPAKVRPFRPVELAAAAGVVVLADVALWADGTIAPGGFGLALLFAVLPLLMFATVRWRLRGSLRLGVVVGLLVLVALRCAVAPTAGTALAGIALLAAFGLVLRLRNVSILEIALSTVGSGLKLPARLRSGAVGLSRLAARTRLGQVSLLPIVIPAGLVALFLGVFALANPVVAHGIATAWSALARIVALPSPGRVFFWATALAIGFACVRPAVRRVLRPETAMAPGEASPTSLLVARNALVGLNLLFLAESALDATYLWSGSPPTGMHTQQYAHQGAFWLTVALLLLTAVIGVMFRGALAQDPRAKAARSLAYAWTVQGLVLALGTYRRIGIHIVKSGLSDLRIVGILGTSLVVGGVVLVALKLRSGKTFAWLVRRQLDAFALTAVLYAVFPTHLVSAHVNVARIQGGEYRPLLHTFRQSHETESAAALLPLLDHPDARVRQGVAALLQDERDRLRAATQRRTSWRERDLVTSRALVQLEAASGAIATALGDVDPTDARRVLLEISRVANEDRSLEELLSIPAATNRSRSDVL